MEVASLLEQMDGHLRSSADEEWPAHRGSQAMYAAEADAIECLHRFVELAWPQWAVSLDAVADHDKAQLYRCTQHFVMAMKQAGVTPERALARVKDLVNVSVRVSDALQPIMDFVVPCAIQAYYQE